MVFALAHATGKVGRFTLIERWRNNERLLAPNENPLKVCAFVFSLVKCFKEFIETVLSLFTISGGFVEKGRLLHKFEGEMVQSQELSDFRRF